jgi:spore germination cell wall hydrolase CwlJ-like protein
MKRILLLALLLWALRLLAAPATVETVAAVLMAEAWVDKEPGMTAVAEVIYNQAKEQNTTPYRAVMKFRAFACLNDKSDTELRHRYRWEPDFEKALAIAEKIYEGTLPNTTKGANRYKVKGTEAEWAKGLKPVTIIGRLEFYKVPRP